MLALRGREGESLNMCISFETAIEISKLVRHYGAGGALERERT